MGVELQSTPSYQEASHLEVLEQCNGCGPSSSKVSFDKVLGVNLFEACCIHDWDYYRGGTKVMRKKADIRFISNVILLILDQGSHHVWWRIPLCFTFYIAVRVGGRKHFTFK